MADNSRPRGAGKKFFKGDPRAKMGGRKKKTVTWKAAEDALREALPRILLMDRDEVKELIGDNPTGAEQLASTYLDEHPVEAVNRFLGKTPTPLTGEGGKPLIPDAPPMLIPAIDFTHPLWTAERLDAFIAATAARASEKKPG